MHKADQELCPQSVKPIDNPAAATAAHCAESGGSSHAHHTLHAEEIKRARDLEAKKRRKAEKKAQSVGLAIEAAAPSKQEVGTARKTAELSTPIAFVFPGQGSQAVGMLQVSPVRWV